MEIFIEDKIVQLRLVQQNDTTIALVNNKTKRLNNYWWHLENPSNAPTTR